jgi:hypothetical protein
MHIASYSFIAAALAVLIVESGYAIYQLSLVLWPS